MKTKHLLTSLLLGALAEITLLGVFVFVELRSNGDPPAHAFHAWELSFLALPLLLLAAAAVLPARALRRR